jgi:DNA-binding NtrC family response regulator
MTCGFAHHAPVPLHSDLAGLLLRVRVPALRERVEDIRAIAESFLRATSPLETVRCSQALIDRFCGYDWPGNVTELRSVLRHLLLEPHSGLLDLRHLADLMCRDETCFALLQGGHCPSHIETAFIHRQPSPETRSMQ